MRRHLKIPGMLICSSLALMTLTCSGNGGNGPTGDGSVAGTVLRPFDLTADFQPVEGATVHLTGSDFDSSVVTGPSGTFLFDPVPAGQVTLTAQEGLCESGASESVTVTKDETTNQNLTLTPSSVDDCLSLPLPGPARIQIDATTNEAIALYDRQDRTSPALATIDLSTGEGTIDEFTGLVEVYDLVLSGSMAIMNFQSIAGFGVRFYDLSTQATLHDEIFLPGSSATQHPGRLAVAEDAGVVFVTHTTRQGASVTGMVFALSLTSMTLIDADDDAADGQPGFTNGLVEDALGWARGIAFDADSSEILVGNFDQPVMTAIDWSRWGTFDRSAGPEVESDAIRRVPVNPGITGFAVSFWDFADGRGVAGWPASGSMPAALYVSGASEPSQTLITPDLEFARADFARPGEYVLTVIPERQSWISIFRDDDAVTAVEERSLITLEGSSRFESRFEEFPPIEPALIPRSFAVNPTTNRLYVAYDSHTLLEVFVLESGGI